MSEILAKVRANERIKLPDFNPDSLKTEPNDYQGTVGDIAYQFEGEEDLLHLILSRCDGAPLSIGDAQCAASWLFQGVSPALIWFKPAEAVQHFYLGHDDLVSLSP